MSSGSKRDTGGLSTRHAATLRLLKREIGRREALQKALKTSEQHHRRMLETSGRMQDHLRRLSHEILSAQEEERKRISRELHDEIGQALTAINVKLAGLRKEADVTTAGLKKHIASTQRLVEASMNTVHRFARDLRPPLLDDLGLIPALHSCLKDFTKRMHIPVRFTAFAAVERLHVDDRTVLFRVAQEALANVAQHARATAVDVSIKNLDGVVRMELHDNGKSFQVERVLSDTKTKRLGLLGMRERVEMIGGTLAIESTPKTGTTIRAEIPFRKASREIGPRSSEVRQVSKITVLLADDHTIIREGLRALLENEPDIEVVGEAETGRQAVQRTQRLLPAVVVIDIAMPSLNGLEATRQILKAVPATRVLILSAHRDDEYVDEAIRIGAAGYLIKQTSAHVLPEAIREAYKGKSFFDPSVKKRLGDRRQDAPRGASGWHKRGKIRLTSREVEILQLIAEGKANKQAADELGISIKTVEKHRQNLMSKLDIHDTAGLTRYAIASGIIESGVRIIIE